MITTIAYVILQERCSVLEFNTLVLIYSWRFLSLLLHLVVLAVLKIHHYIAKKHCESACTLDTTDCLPCHPILHPVSPYPMSGIMTKGVQTSCSCTVLNFVLVWRYILVWVIECKNRSGLLGSYHKQSLWEKLPFQKFQVGPWASRVGPFQSTP